MMKHCDAEKPVFSLVKVNLSLLFWGFCNFAVLAQVSINGFARLTETDIPFPGMLRSTNFNNDQYNDIIAVSTTGRTVFSLKGKDNGSFEQLQKSTLQFIPSNVSAINPQDNTLFISSRSSRKAGVYQIKTGGELQLLEQFSWRGAPSALASGDLDNNGSVEYFVAGAGFEGITQLKKNKNRLAETKIEKILPYSALVLADCNNDSHLDLVGYNISKQALTMFYNNSRGELSYTRELPVSQHVKEIHATDINLDGYTDLLLVYTKGIELIYGDGPASFMRRKLLFHREQIKELVYGDYNKDGIRDLAYNTLEGKGITIAFGTEAETFTPYFILENQNTLSLISFYSNYLEGLAITLDNKLLLLSRLPSLTQAEKLLFPITPDFMMTFPGFNSGLSNLLLLQKDNVGFVIRDNSGLPSLYNSRKLSSEYSSVLFFRKKGESREFYFWKEGLRSIDKVTLAGKGQTLTHSTIYTKGRIIDVSTATEIDDKGTQLLVLTESNENFSIVGYSRENKVTFSNTVSSSSKQQKRKIANSEKLYALEEKEDTLTIQLIPMIGDKQSIKTLHLPKTKLHFLKSVGVTHSEGYRSVVFADSGRNKLHLVYFDDGKFIQKKHQFKNKVKPIRSMVCNAQLKLLLGFGLEEKYLVDLKQNAINLTDVTAIAKGSVAFCELLEGERFPRTLVVFPKNIGIGVINR